MMNKEKENNCINKSYSPKNLINILIKKHPYFQYGQQDSIELLPIILNDINKK